MAQSLVEHGHVTTTLPKAKDIRPFLERLVTLAVKTRKLAAAGDRAGALRARRSIHRLLGDRCIIASEHASAYNEMSDARRAKTLRMASGRRHRTGEPRGRLAFTAEAVTHRLIDKVAPRFQDRPGGYTRLIRFARSRLGDNAPLAMVQLVGNEDVPHSLTKPKRSARKRRCDARFAFAIRSAKNWTVKGKTVAADEADPNATVGEGNDAPADEAGSADAPSDEAK